MIRPTTEFGPHYQEGHLSIENEELIQRLDLQDCNVGVQVSTDGRIWICVNGVAYLRFKPHRVTGRVESPESPAVSTA